MRLLDTKTGLEVKRDDTVTDFRGDKAKIIGFYTKGSNSSGRVIVETDTFVGEYYPSVYGLEIEE